MPDDRVAAALKDIRGRHDLWTGWSHPDSGFVTLANAVEASAEDIPRLLAAVERVLELAEGAHVMLANCETSQREPVAWDLDPEAIRGAISAALLGEGADGG